MATQRVTIREAADLLGVSKEAIRKRVVRGTLRSELGEDGRSYVYIEAGGDVAAAEAPTHERDVLISEMCERIASLERQLDQERQANREHRRLLAALERIPPQLEPRELPETVEEEPERAEPRPGTSEAQEGAHHVPCWRRMFGGD